MVRSTPYAHGGPEFSNPVLMLGGSMLLVISSLCIPTPSSELQTLHSIYTNPPSDTHVYTKFKIITLWVEDKTQWFTVFTEDQSLVPSTHVRFSAYNTVIYWTRSLWSP